MLMHCAAMVAKKHQTMNVVRIPGEVRSVRNYKPKPPSLEGHIHNILSQGGKIII